MNALAVVFGAVILLVMFGGMFAVTAREAGWREAAAVWCIALAGAGVLAGAVCLVVWGLGAW